MNLKGIISVSGKPGLFKLVGQNKAGFVLESLDAQKLKIVVNMSTTKMASIEDITVFGEEEDLRLPDIFEAIKLTDNIPVVKGSDEKTLRAYFRTVAPAHDETKVYFSDMKKILTWYGILKELPLFEEEPPLPVEQKETAPGEDEKPVEK